MAIRISIERWCKSCHGRLDTTPERDILRDIANNTSFASDNPPEDLLRRIHEQAVKGFRESTIRMHKTRPMYRIALGIATMILVWLSVLGHYEITFLNVFASTLISINIFLLVFSRRVRSWISMLVQEPE